MKEMGLYQVAEKKGNELSYISEKKGGGSIGYFDNVGHIVKMSVFLERQMVVSAFHHILHTINMVTLCA